MVAMIERLTAWLGADFRELAGATIDADIPLSTALINRAIEEQLSRAQGRISAAVVEPHDGDRVTVHLTPRAALLPRMRVQLQIAGQPDLPSSPVLVVRWSLDGGLGILARVASPILSLFDVLPPGVRVDGDLIGIDVEDVLRSKGFGWVLPLVRQVQVHTSYAGVRVRLALAR